MTETKKVSVLFTKILNQAFNMTHTFDFEVSLHYWLLWPTVRRSILNILGEISVGLQLSSTFISHATFFMAYALQNS